MNKIFSKSVLVLLLLSLCVHIGCFSFSRGKLSGYTEVPNSEILQHYSYPNEVSSSPTQYSPKLLLKFKKMPSYQYEAVEYYEELRTTNKGANAIPNIMILGGCITALTGLVIWVDSSKSTEVHKTGLNLLVGGLLGAIFGGIIKVDETVKVTDNKIEGNIVTKNRDGETTSLINTKINVKIDNRMIQYTTNWQGEISVDLVKDFGLNNFEEEKNIYVEFEVVNDVSNTSNIKLQNIKLRSSIWTTKHISILADEIHVYDTPGSSGKKIGVCKKLEKYQILESNNSGWIKINYNGKNGWVSSIAGKTIWTSK